MTTDKKRIYLSSPHMSGKEQQYVEEAFKTNWIAPLGPHVDMFEEDLANYLDVEGVAALSSGTAAIHLALLLLGVRQGDAVFCSALTFAATANPILYVGAEAVFIDSEPETWNMSPVALGLALEEADREGKLPKAVIVVNLYGQSADMEPITELCEKFGVGLIEDAAESLGATYRGKKSGSFGRFGILSFNGNKIITTSGGGALVSDDLEALERARYLATQARQPARHYEHTEAGYNYRLSNVLAGIGRAQLEVLEERVKARRRVFERYRDELGPVEGFQFMPEASFGRSTRWLTALTVDPELCGASRDQIIDALAEENIEARPVWKPMQMQPLYQGCKFYAHLEGDRGTVPSSSLTDLRSASVTPEPSPGHPEKDKGTFLLSSSPNLRGSSSANDPSTSLSVSERLFELGLCLPSGSNLTKEEQGRVIDVILKALGKG